VTVVKLTRNIYTFYSTFKSSELIEIDGAWQRIPNINNTLIMS